MKQIQWQIDKTTEYWAKRISLPASLDWQPQVSGEKRRMLIMNWRRRLIGETSTHHLFAIGQEYVVPSVENIKECFRENYFLEGLILTVGWGGMARAQKSIYRESLDLKGIEAALSAAKNAINQDGDIQSAWKKLTDKEKDQLGWGRVITSKVLHFLARSCGYEENPPVPFDNAVTWNLLRAWFFSSIALKRQGQYPPLPQTWWDNDNSWESYNRYMTAIICWAEQRGWHTTDVDASVFAKLLSIENSTADPSKVEDGE